MLYLQFILIHRRLIMANSEDEKQQALLKKLSEQGAETKEEVNSSPEAAVSKDSENQI